MSRRTVLPAALAGALLVAAALTGCSSGGLPGGTGAGAASGGGAAGSSNSSGTGHAKACSVSGTAIPAGKYAGKVTATLDTVMQITVPGAGTIHNAGRGKQGMNGTVTITSNGKTVSGSITLGGLGHSEIDAGEAGTAGTGSFTGTISGPAASPVVDGSMKGEWDAFSPVMNTSGHAENPIHAGLHVTSATCGAITGDAIAMFAEIAKPVAQYITVSGTGTWTATRR